MRIFKYLGKHAGAVTLIFLLLFAQAFCDLMLPNYTSKIVDVGIQQSGIERVAPERMSVETFAAVEQHLSAEDAVVLEGSYAPIDQNGSPVAESTAEGEAGEEGAAAGAGAAASAAVQYYELRASGWFDERIDDVIARPLAEVNLGGDAGVSDDMVRQAGIAAARAEYEKLGYDTGALQMNYLLFTGLKMMGFVALGAIVAALVGLVASRTGAKIGSSLRSRLYAKVMSFSDAEVQRFSAASLITRATNDVQQIQMMTIMMLRMVLYAPILGLGGIVMVARTNASMSWIIALAVLVVFVVTFGLMLLAMPKFRIMQKLVDRVNLISRERLTGVQVVRAFGRQETEQDRFDTASTDLMRTQLFTNRVMTFMMPSIFFIMNLVSIAIVWVGAGQVDAGAIQTGDLIAFITYAMMVMMGFVMLSMLAMIAPRADVSAARIDEVLDTEVSIVDPAVRACGAGGMAQAAESPAPGAVIEFDRVSFGYDDGSEPVIRDVSFIADAGKTLAIIGATGSGKSTILKLIERFYDVDAGAVRIDGVDVREMGLHELRSQLGYVPQRAFLFSGTIASNVGYSDDGVDEARLLEAIDIAQANELLQLKEEGLNSEILQGGANVSGGQRQRLAIARALASDARALLFDDSFSALDYKTDSALRQALAERLPGKTQIIVAQRIATVMQADKIVVLDEGRMVGEGSHAELLATCPQYREIALSQLSPEELEREMGKAGAASSDGGDAVSDAKAWEGGDAR